MNIKNNVIKNYLSNVYFINGTAYAGKSTMCKLLSNKYDLIHCKENYNSERIFKNINELDQPNLSYFNIKKSWQEFFNRSPDQYEEWVNGNNKELTDFEILELISISQHKKVIVDTNIPIYILEKIANYNQIAIMVTKPEISSQRFFDRDDPEKKFLLNEINKCENPNKVYDNFIACIEQINRNQYTVFKNSGMFVIEREEGCEEKIAKKIAKHFGL